MCFPKAPKYEAPPPPPPKPADPVAPLQAAPPNTAPDAPAQAPGAYQSPRQAANARKRLRIDRTPGVAPKVGAGLRVPT
jgi:hypothetical protein